MNQELPNNTQLSHYRIISKLGAGGMGEVYLAEDTRLRRNVALKVLSDEYTKSEERLHRFQREAYAASKLNHPNILTIFEAGVDQGTPFIATEFIEGETVRVRLARARMDIREALDIAIQAGSALSAAHQAGIIHRDIKPENIMLRDDGYVKVLDFGLAKLTERHQPTINTQASTIVTSDTDPGVVMGTVNYLSPEQARGLDLDARTDVFSLGIVLFEMVAGRAPFDGLSSSDLIAAILTREPPPLARFEPSAPNELQRIVAKSLRKDREERYQTIKDLLIDLKNLREEQAFEEKLEQSRSPESTGLAPVVTPGGIRVATAD